MTSSHLYTMLYIVQSGVDELDRLAQSPESTRARDSVA